MKLSEAIQKYSDFEVDEEKLKKLIQKPKSVYDLKKGDIYWRITNYASVVWKNWCDDDDDKTSRSLGNAFLMEEEARFRLKQIRVEEELIKLGGTRNHSELEKYKTKYWLYYNSLAGDLVILDTEKTYVQGGIYFKTFDEAQNAIRAVDENIIKKYLFYAED